MQSLTAKYERRGMWIVDRVGTGEALEMIGRSGEGFEARVFAAAELLF